MTDTPSTGAETVRAGLMLAADIVKEHRDIGTEAERDLCDDILAALSTHVAPGAIAPVGPVERALLVDANTSLAPFKVGDPGKHVQTLLPTPEWKALSKACARRGVSLSLMLRLAVRQYLVWLECYRSPAEVRETGRDTSRLSNAVRTAQRLASQMGGEFVIVPEWLEGLKRRVAASDANSTKDNSHG